jgi:hypothetical protein
MRNLAAEERYWIAGRAHTLFMNGMSLVDSSKQAMYESQQHLAAEAKGSILAEDLTNV